MPSPIGLSTAVIAEKLDVIAAGQNEIKAAVSSLDARMDAFERHSIKATADLQNETARAHDRLNDHDKRFEVQNREIESLRQAVQPLIYANKILVWIAGLVGASLIALVWAIVIGQVHIVFPGGG